MTALHIIVGYYNIRISLDIQDMTTFVTDFGKFIFNCLPMGMCALRDIYQAKVDELLGDIGGFKNYIDNIIVLSKDSFDKHIYQLIIIFGRLSAVGLKYNATKYSFGLKEIPYLVHVITSEGIIHDQNKVQEIMDIR